MKTTTSNPKAQILLGAGLDILHFESKEWLDTIAFWKDEVKFFNNLLKKKEVSKKSNPDYENMLKNLDKIHVDLFEDLEDSIVEHEKLLARIEQGEYGLSDAEYRERHRILLERMDTFKHDFKVFKRIVFDYAKNL
ncbi:hypothetical protein [Winogradskyella aurantia]|uniref:Uncharacterized protein n=1 Tax=Winogradskyella aurantia TaxID=1915063 RepID=A0A265UWX0_9FLAO|nr:hypothetical protein [Winogradskyella aurantia]OZV69801.1 hypothetical protein CA834_04045 [Winogradskyella aurantia]